MRDACRLILVIRFLDTMHDTLRTLIVSSIAYAPRYSEICRYDMLEDAGSDFSFFIVIFLSTGCDLSRLRRQFRGFMARISSDKYHAHGRLQQFILDRSI